MGDSHMKKQKISKTMKDIEDICEFEEKLLTNFHNLDKIYRKENKW